MKFIFTYSLGCSKMSMSTQENETDKEILFLKIAGYSEKSIKYYINQTNIGQIDYPNIKHIEIGKCGDIIILNINLCEGPIIHEIKFKYIGCPALASSGSSMTQLAKGKTIQKAKILGGDEIEKEYILVSQNNEEVQIMHPTTYKIRIIKKPQNVNFIGKTISTIKIEDKLFLVKKI